MKLTEQLTLDIDLNSIASLQYLQQFMSGQVPMGQLGFKRVI